MLETIWNGRTYTNSSISWRHTGDVASSWGHSSDDNRTVYVRLWHAHLGRTRPSNGRLEPRHWRHQVNWRGNLSVSDQQQGGPDQFLQRTPACLRWVRHTCHLSFSRDAVSRIITVIIITISFIDVEMLMSLIKIILKIARTTTTIFLNVVNFRTKLRWYRPTCVRNILEMLYCVADVEKLAKEKEGPAKHCDYLYAHVDSSALMLGILI